MKNTIEELDRLYFTNTLFCVKDGLKYYTDGYFFKWSTDKNKAIFRNKEFWEKKFGPKLETYKLINYSDFLTKTRKTIKWFLED